MKLFGIEYQYLKWQCTLKLVQCTDNYCLCNGVCVGRQQNHFIIDKIILQNLTRIQELKTALPIDESVQYGNTTGSRPSNLTVVNSIFDDHR
jgi:hypothetical protein